MRRRSGVMVKLALLGAAPVAALVLFAYPHWAGGSGPAVSAPVPAKPVASAWSDPPSRKPSTPAVDQAVARAIVPDAAAPQPASDGEAKPAIVKPVLAKQSRAKRAASRNRLAAGPRTRARTRTAGPVPESRIAAASPAHDDPFSAEAPMPGPVAAFPFPTDR